MNKFLDRIFPLRKIKNISMFYILSSVYSAWIVAGVWVFIWGAFMTKTQIGISDSITFAVGFLVELPSGVWADFMGRKKAILLGNIMLFTGNLFVGLSSSFFGITSWYMVWTMGYAFQSGATEALAYDSLKKLNRENEWHKVISTSTIIGRITSLTCTALGGYLFTVGFRLPYLVAATISLIGILASANLDEIMVKIDRSSWSLINYFSQVKDGVKVLGRPGVLPISMMSLLVTGIGFMYNWGLLRPLTAERFGFTPTTYSLLLATTSFTTIFAISILKFLQKKIKLESLIIFTGLGYSVVFFLVGLPHNLITGGVLTISLAIFLTYTDILFSQFINRHTSESHRATTLSAVALFTKLPYVLLTVLIGKIAENNGLPGYTLIVGTTAMFLWLVSFVIIQGNRRRMLAG